MERSESFPQIPQEKLVFARSGEKRIRQTSADRSVGYLEDAWNRFRKNKASIVAAVIILLIVLYALAVPLLGISEQMDTYYKRKGARVSWLAPLGIADGGAD